MAPRTVATSLLLLILSLLGSVPFGTPTGSSLLGPSAVSAQLRWSDPPARVAECSSLCTLHDGTIVLTGLHAFTSTDLGHTFTVSPAANFDRSTNFVTEANGFVFTGTDTTLYRSSDRGYTWSAVAKVGLKQIVATHSSTLFGERWDSYLLRSTNNGASWSRVKVPANALVVTALAVDSANTLWLGTLSGIWSSINEGATWVENTTDFTRAFEGTIHSMEIAASGNMMVATRAGLFHSRGFGQPFTKVHNYYFQLASYDGDGSFYGIESTGNLYVTSDQGQNWTMRNSRPVSAFAYAGSHFFVQSEFFYEVSNLAATWTPLTVDLGNFSGTPIVVARQNGEVFAAFQPLFQSDTSFSGLLRSRDYGQTWSRADAGLDPRIASLSFDYDGRAFASTRSGLFRSLDDCASWTKLIDSTTTIQDIQVDSDGTLYGGVPFGPNQRSTNHGVSWQHWNANLDTALIALPDIRALILIRPGLGLGFRVVRNHRDLGFSFPPNYGAASFAPMTIGADGMAYCGMDSTTEKINGLRYLRNLYGFFSSADSGKHWIRSHDPFVSPKDSTVSLVQQIFTDPNGNVYAYDGRKIFQSSDRGAHFHLYLDSASNESGRDPLYRSSDGSLYLLLATTTNNKPYLIHSAVEGFADVRPSLTLGHSVSPTFRVTPSAFSSVASISYDLPVTGSVTIEVLDERGTILRTVFSGMQMSGTHNVSLDGSTLSGGVYFVRMTTPTGSGIVEVVKE